jgi:hypothetical protein
MLASCMPAMLNDMFNDMFASMHLHDLMNMPDVEANRSRRPPFEPKIEWSLNASYRSCYKLGTCVRCGAEATRARRPVPAIFRIVNSFNIPSPR